MNKKQNLQQLPVFKDDQGKIALWQQPNLPLLLWFGLKAVSYVITDERVKNSLDHLSMAFLFTWAYLELTQGINYFRRSLGLVVIIACIARFVQIAL